MRIRFRGLSDPSHMGAWCRLLRGVPAQLGRGKSCHVCQIPDVLHWNQQNLMGVTGGARQKHKHTLAQKQWCRSPASVRSCIMRTMRVVFTQQRMLKVVAVRKTVFYSIARPPLVMKKKKPKWLVSWLRSRSAILWRATSPWRTNVLSVQLRNTWAATLEASCWEHTRDDLTPAKETNRSHVCKLMEASQKSDLLHWMPILGGPGGVLVRARGSRN